MTEKSEPCFFEFEKCGSTNDELYILAKKGAVAGTVVLTKMQTNGCGTNGRSFFSPPKTGIYMSVLLRGISVQNLYDITPLSAVCVSKVLDSECAVQSQIKKVNDVYIDGKKVCGILTRAQTSGKNVDFVIVGIGINLFRPKDGFPKDIEHSAGYVLEKYDEKKKIMVAEKTAKLLLDGSSSLRQKSFLKSMYDYYNSREIKCDK